MSALRERSCSWSTIGVTQLQSDGTSVRVGRENVAYAAILLNFPRVLTGFVNEHLRHSAGYWEKKVDPLVVHPERLDVYPRLGLGGHDLGEDCNLCDEVVSFLSNGGAMGTSSG